MSTNGSCSCIASFRTHPAAAAYRYFVCRLRLEGQRAASAVRRTAGLAATPARFDMSMQFLPSATAPTLPRTPQQDQRLGGALAKRPPSREPLRSDDSASLGPERSGGAKLARKNATRSSRTPLPRLTGPRFTGGPIQPRVLGSYIFGLPLPGRAPKGGYFP